MHADRIIILVSSTLLISYVSSLAYSKTRVPEIIWLISFGVLLGPVLNVFNTSLFLEIANLITILALAIILFEAGLNVDIVYLIQTMMKSTILSIATIISIILSVGISLNYIMPESFPILQAMLVGAMVGGTSTVSVSRILSGLDDRVGNIVGARVLLMMESVISDPLSIIASITLIKIIILPDSSVQESFRDIFSTFVLSSLLGILSGIFWANILSRLRERALTYMITLSVLFPIYILSDSIIGLGGGVMAALTFGLSISNYRYVTRRLGVDSRIRLDKGRLRDFQEEVTFFIKSFFFVYIGLIASISFDYVLIGLGLLLLVIIIRLLVVQGIGRVMLFSKEEMTVSQVVFALGLPSFVMAQLPKIFDPGGHFFVNPGIYHILCMPIVLGTVIFSSVAGPYLGNRLIKKRGKV